MAKNQVSEIDLIASFGWGPRAETVHDCVEHTSELLSLLRELYPDWKKWQYHDNSKFLPLEGDSIMICLLKGLNYYDTIPYPIVDLGYSASIYPHKKHYGDWVLRLHCGSFGTLGWNQIYLACDEDTSENRTVAKRIDWEQYLKRAVQIWDADEAYLGTSQSNVFRCRDQEFDIGWITYVSKRLVPKLPKLKEAVVEDMGFGWMIFVLPEDYPSEFPEMPEECVKRLKSVVDALATVNKRISKDSAKKVQRKKK